MDADLDEVRGETSVCGCHPEVRHQRESEASANRGVLERGDDGLLTSEQPHSLDVQRIFTSARRRLAALRIAIRKVRARAERLALGTEHQGAALGLIVERLEGVGEIANQIEVEEIVGRPVNLELGYIAVERYGYVAIFWFHHRIAPFVLGIQFQRGFEMIKIRKNST